MRSKFYLPPTQEPYQPFLPSRKVSPPFGWYSLCLPTKEWPGWVDMGGWSHTEINIPYRALDPATVTDLSTNRARCWLTSLIEANALTTTPGHHRLECGYIWNDKLLQSLSNTHRNMFCSAWPRHACHSVKRLLCVTTSKTEIRALAAKQFHNSRKNSLVKSNSLENIHKANLLQPITAFE